jgi:hypothetical protein
MHYAYHSPTTPIQELTNFPVGPIVSSPPISSTGPIKPTWFNRTWIESSGKPLVHFTGQLHDWSSVIPLSGPDVGREILQLRAIITTGDDDLRGGEGPNDNCDVILTFTSGPAITIQNINNGYAWTNKSTNTVVLPLPDGTRVGDIRSFTLRTQFGGGLSGDNWKVDRVALVASLPIAQSLSASISLLLLS